MPWAESRILKAERSIEDLYRRLLALADLEKWDRQKLQALEREQPAGGGGGGVYSSCTLTAGLGHGSSLAGQSVWTMPGRAMLGGTFLVYNDGPTPANDIPPGKQVILAANPDGTYTVIGVYC